MTWLSGETKNVYEQRFCGSLTGSHVNPVIFVDPDGRPLCRLKDKIWKLPTGEAMYWDADDPRLDRLYDEAKELLAHILYHPQLYDLAPSTIGNYYNGLKALAASTAACDYDSLRVFFTTPRIANKIIDKILVSPKSTAFLQIGAGLFNSLVKIDEETLGFRINRGNVYRRLRKLLKQLNRESFQHPVIPWDIYKHIIEHVKDLTEFYLRRLKHPAYQDILNMFYVREKDKSHHLRKLAAEELLTSTYTDISFERPRTRFLVYELGTIQELARIGVLLFTGCRMSELVTILPKKAKHLGNGAYKLEGRSTKEKHGDVYWVTNADGAKAVELALLVRETIGVSLEIDPKTSIPALFPSLKDFPANIGTARSEYWMKSRKHKSGRTRLNGVFNRMDIEVPEITEVSHNFLSELSSDCRIDLDLFRIGSVFPLTPHQFRRSLAYYAMRSGNVELGALKRQFKHLAIMMTEYYSSKAFGLGTKTKHTMADLVEKERFAEIDERLRKHLAEYEGLDGAMGWSIRQNIDSVSTDDRVHVIESSRQSILRRAKNGEISYTQTPLGACMSNEPCLTRNRAEVSACLRCKSAVIERPKAERAYAVLRESKHPFLAAQAEHFSKFLMARDRDEATD